MFLIRNHETKSVSHHAISCAGIGLSFTTVLSDFSDCFAIVLESL